MAILICKAFVLFLRGRRFEGKGFRGLFLLYNLSIQTTLGSEIRNTLTAYYTEVKKKDMCTNTNIHIDIDINLDISLSCR